MNRRFKKYGLRSILFFCFAILIFCCRSKNDSNIILTDESVPKQWADMTLFVTKNTPGNTPTYASRALGYISLTMYESIVKGYEDHFSLEGQLNELRTLPYPEKNKKYNWLVSLNAGQALILKNIYMHTSDINKLKIDSLETLILKHLTKMEVSEDVVERSIQYGRSVATAIFDWSIKDGGHRGYLNNFDKTVVYPSYPGMWQPPLYGQATSRFPLHPHWGNNRTFLRINSELPIPDPIRYSTDSTSDCYKEFLDVYAKNGLLTQEEKEIALWWHDDPSETYTPPGHSYNLATIAITSKKPSLIEKCETYARTGIAVADAFIVCWKIKYIYFSERPSSFLVVNVDDEWQPFWPDPPFPAFPSGHATQAAAVAEVLTGLYGNSVSIMDDTHGSRPRDEIRNVDFKPRTYSSFWHIAEETAYSRFLGGIHTNQDNKIGLVIGKQVGHHVNSLKWSIINPLHN